MGQRVKLHYKVFDNNEDFVEFQNDLDVIIHQINPIGQNLEVQSDSETNATGNLSYSVFVVYHLTSESVDDTTIPLLFNGMQKVIKERLRLQDDLALQPAHDIKRLKQIHAVGLALINDEDLSLIECAPQFFFKNNDVKWQTIKACTKEQRHRIGLAFLLAEYDTIDWAVQSGLNIEN